MKALQFLSIEKPINDDSKLYDFDQANPSGQSSRPKSYWNCIDGAWTCVLGTRTVGMLAWKIDREHDGTEWVNVTDVCVVEEFRRHGIAKRMMHLAMIDWKRRKLWRYYLHVVVDNHGAQALYKTCGFSIKERIKGYYHEDYPYLDEDVIEDPKDDAFEMERRSSKVIKKEMHKTRRGIEKKEQLSKEVRFGSTDYLLYALRYCCHPGGWGWKIDYDDHGLIECHDNFYDHATDAFRAVERYFEEKKHDIEKEAIRRKALMAAGRDPMRE